MKKKNTINRFYSAEHIICANLELQSNQKILREKFGINNTEYILDPKFIKTYSKWNLDKQNTFLSIIGGKCYFKKIKGFFEDKIQETNI